VHCLRGKLKVGFVHNAYIEYRTPFFESLSSQYNVNFFFERLDSKFKARESRFSFKLLKSLKITDNYSFSPLLFFFLVKGRFNLFIAGAVGEINTYIAFLTSILLRKPLVFWDENWFWPRTKWRFIAWPFLSQLLKNAGAIVVPGSLSKKFYGSISPSIESKIFLAPNVSLLPQDAEIRFRANELKKTLALQDKIVILYCGRLIRVKGFEYLLKAFSKLQVSKPNTVLLVVGGVHGTGNKYSSEELERIYRVFGREKVHFAGALVNPEKAAYFLLADVVVVPSIFLNDEYEVWGFAVNESMSVGKPVVATTAVGSAFDLIQDGTNGYIVPEKDPENLFNALRSLLENSSHRIEMGEQSLRIIQEGFVYENMLRGFKQAISFALRFSS